MLIGGFFVFGNEKTRVPLHMEAAQHSVFNPVEFNGIKMQADLNSFMLTQGDDCMKTNSLSLHSFAELTGAIQRVHDELAAQASRAVNVSLTLRNWLIGCHIVEYEQGGTDRAQYGEALLDKLADELGKLAIPRTQARELRRYRIFYTTYPQIRETLTPEFILHS